MTTSTQAWAINMRAAIDDARGQLRQHVAPMVFSPFAANFSSGRESVVACNALVAKLEELMARVDEIQIQFGQGPSHDVQAMAKPLPKRCVASPSAIIESLERTHAAIQGVVHSAAAAHPVALKARVASNYASFVAKVDRIANDELKLSTAKLQTDAIQSLQVKETDFHTDPLQEHCATLRAAIIRRDKELAHVTAVVERLQEDAMTLERAEATVDTWLEEQIKEIDHQSEVELENKTEHLNDTCDGLSHEITMLRAKLKQRSEQCVAAQARADDEAAKAARERETHEIRLRTMRRIASVAHMYPVHPLGHGENGSCAPLSNVRGRGAVLEKYAEVLQDFGRPSRAEGDSQTTSFLVLRHNKEFFITPLSSDGATTTKYSISGSKISKQYELKCPHGVSIQVDPAFA